MRKASCLCVLMILYLHVQAQKKKIDNESHRSWVVLQDYGISGNGKFIWYKYGEEGNLRETVLQSVDGKYRRTFGGTIVPVFTADSRYFVAGIPEGMLIRDLAGSKDILLRNCRLVTAPLKGEGRWLCYQNTDTLFLKDLIAGKQLRWPLPKGSAARPPVFNDKGTVLLRWEGNKLHWMDLKSGREKMICTDGSATDFTFDAAGKQLAFTTQTGDEKIIRYYREGMDSAILHTTDASPGIDKAYRITYGAPSFTGNGKVLVFQLQRRPVAPASPDPSVLTSKVDVWHYKDEYLQSHQQDLAPGQKWKTFMAAAPVRGGRVMQMEYPDSVFVSGRSASLFLTMKENFFEENGIWNPGYKADYELVDVLSGQRSTILSGSPKKVGMTLSPGEKFACWYDSTLRNYLCYEIATGVTRNITHQISEPLFLEAERYWKGGTASASPFFYWLANDRALLISDRYDLWQVDPLGRIPPINITAGYGKKEKIRFHPAVPQEELLSIRPGKPVLLEAVNTNNQYRGFFTIPSGRSATPAPAGEMGPFIYAAFDLDFDVYPIPPDPIKAANANVYMFTRQSDTSAQNLVVLKDYKEMSVITSIRPQQAYNWMKAELVKWTTLDGKPCSGVLYKPEDFDPAKKYPVIFHYYETFSRNIYQFHKPSLSNSDLNIPWYVSNGYLVFTPDIRYTMGHMGESAVNSIVPAAGYLASLPYVDAARMGLQGHSFGGYETYYLITHTRLFAAAQAGAGIVDLVGDFAGGMGFGDRSRADVYVRGQMNMGVSLWERPDLYLKNSALLDADKVTTPLLILHNKKDGAVPFGQSLSMFISLRRLHKKVWMLQYDDEDHTLEDYANQRDFTIRQQQFFDHYLKGKPAPRWMTKGIPYKVKGIDSGLQPDPQSLTP